MRGVKLHSIVGIFDDIIFPVRPRFCIGCEVIMSKENSAKNILQKTLTEACQGTSVTTRELIAELSKYDLTAIREGEMTADDLKPLVLDIADGKDNVNVYRVEQKNSGVADAE